MFHSGGGCHIPKGQADTYVCYVVHETRRFLNFPLKANVSVSKEKKKYNIKSKNKTRTQGHDLSQQEALH